MTKLRGTSAIACKIKRGSHINTLYKYVRRESFQFTYRYIILISLVPVVNRWIYTDRQINILTLVNVANFHTYIYHNIKT